MHLIKIVSLKTSVGECAIKEELDSQIFQNFNLMGLTGQSHQKERIRLWLCLV